MNLMNSRLLSLLKTMQMTKQQMPVSITQVHAVALAIAEVFAILALAVAHPFAIAIGCIAVLPNLHKVILVDVTLVVVGTYACACGYRAIGHHRAYGNAGLTAEKPAAGLAFVVAKKSFATIIGTDTSLFSCFADEIKHPAKLLVG